MPLADSQSSFHAAVRHLFRHLSEPQALSANPIVSRFFERDEFGRIVPAKSRIALERIRHLIKLGAERCRDADIALGNAERGQRRFALVRDCFLQSLPPSDSASKLALSIRQWYRLRADTCVRIAKFIQAYDVMPPLQFAPLSELRFDMDRASACVEAGCWEKGIEYYQRIAANCVEFKHKIEALCRRAEVELECGQLAAARQSLSDARALHAQHGATYPMLVQRAATMHIKLLSSRAAWASANYDGAKTDLVAARTEARALADAGGVRLLELVIDTLIECAERATCNGEFRDAEECLARADTALAKILTPAARQKVDMAIARATLNIVSARQSDASLISRHFHMLREVAELARSSGSLRRTVLVQAWLIDADGYVEEGATDIALAHRVLSLACRLGSPRLVARVAIAVADSVLNGRHWRDVPAILRYAQQMLPEPTIEWVLMKNLEANYYLRLGDGRSSLDCASAATQVAQRIGSQRLLAATLRTLAGASHQSGFDAEAADYIAAAIPLVERFGSIMSCLRTYRDAAEITGRRQYAAVAQEVHHALYP